MNMGVIHYPELADGDGEFEYKGRLYRMNVWVKEIDDDRGEREEAC